MVKVTYIISDIDKALAFEWIARYINKNIFDLSFILLNSKHSILEQFLAEQGLEVHRIKCRGKQDWPAAVIKTYRVLKKIKPNVIHCHLLQANIIGLTAGRLAGIKKRIYTRHHSSLHYVYFKKGIWWDKYANKIATKIVAISGIVKAILVEWEGVPEAKIKLIPHGFLLREFCNVESERVDLFKRRANIIESYPVIGVISRFTEWKGVQYTIQAFCECIKQYPDIVLLLLNAQGDYAQNILELLKQLPEKNYRLIPFERDIAAAYKAMDVFVHVPIDEHSEAFGQIYVEALAAGVPSVFTLSGIAPDFIRHKENALVVPFKSSDRIAESIIQILEDKKLVSKIVSNGRQKVNELFGLNQMIERLETLYES